MEISVKNKSDDLVFYTAICAEASQIAYDATKKSPMRISLSNSSAKRFGMEERNYVSTFKLVEGLCGY